MRWLGVLLVLGFGVLVVPSCSGSEPGGDSGDDPGDSGAGGDSGESGSGSSGKSGAGRGGTGSGGTSGASSGGDAGGGPDAGASGGGVGGCRGDADCADDPEGARCSTPTGDCVECLDQADCGDEEECVANRCRSFTTCVNSLDCPTGSVCNRDSGRCVECVADTDCPDGQVCGLEVCRTGCTSDNHCTPLGLLCDTGAGYCVECVSHFDCAEVSFCLDGACARDICTADSTVCESNAVATCNSWGSAWGSPVACASDQTCAQSSVGNAACEPWICAPSSIYCDDDKVMTCSEDGLGTSEDEDCGAAGEVCVGGACQEVVCEAGARFCAGIEVRQCSAQGESSSLVQSCTGQFCNPSTASCTNLVCSPGQPACDQNVATTCNGDGSGYTGTRTNCRQVDQYCDTGECATCAGAWADYCAELPLFTATAQVVDGIGDEFCNIPAISGTVAGMAWHPTTYNDQTRPAAYVLRAAYSDAGFHAHVSVTDPTVVGYIGSDYWRGDSVQFYLAPSATLTGAFGSTQDGGARHVIVTAPSTSYPAGLAVYQSSTGGYTSISDIYFESRLVTGGYEVEVQIPWQAGAAPRTSGARFGFNFSMTVNDSTSSSVPQLEGVLYNALPGTGTCIHPYCDDRAWCTPFLE